METWIFVGHSSVETLFTTCDENDYNVRLTTEESLNKFVKNLKEAVLTRIQVELHGIIKHNPNVESKVLKEFISSFLFSRHGLDLTSSLEILIELYVRWLITKTYLSDLFSSS
ncbi:unnamed protein product [Rotaria sordida]|uniref:Uncharacterized protein n=1 Tax=Rotaria sordida TaxID=392033 RepID=A0A819N9F8_9BILA|nr:unnamed protein product [Rotaria sordida]CAF3992379.1 unnamed protein product [Rotaria sordida]